MLLSKQLSTDQLVAGKPLGYSPRAPGALQGRIPPELPPIPDSVGDQTNERETDEEGSAKSGMALRCQECPDENAEEGCPDA